MHSFIFVLLLILLLFCKRWFGPVQTGLFFGIHFCWCSAASDDTLLQKRLTFELKSPPQLVANHWVKESEVHRGSKCAEARRLSGSLLVKELGDSRWHGVLAEPQLHPCTAQVTSSLDSFWEWSAVHTSGILQGHLLSKPHYLWFINNIREFSKINSPMLV